MTNNEIPDKQKKEHLPVATITKHLEYINGITSKINEMEGILKPKNFYFVGWFGGKTEDEYEDEKDVCRFAVVLKSTFDAPPAGCWEDGEPDGPLMQALKIPLFYESGCVYAFHNLMEAMTRAIQGKEQDTTPPKHTPQEIRSLFLAAGFIENSEIILHWNKKARIVKE